MISREVVQRIRRQQERLVEEAEALLDASGGHDDAVRRRADGLRRTLREYVGLVDGVLDAVSLDEPAPPIR